MIRRGRILRRAAALLGGALAAMVHFALLTALRRRTLTLSERARWLHAWCRVGLKILGIKAEISGEIPGSGLLAANHLSYLDILLISAAAPAVFVSKIEVRSWPLFGLMARLGGSIFIDRGKLRRLPGVIEEAAAALRSGALLVLFPEATTTDGSTVLPFRPALFEAAVRAGVPTAAAHLAYFRPGGGFDRDLCWWGDMELLPHLLATFSRRRIDAHIQVSAVRHPVRWRKAAARISHAEVTAMVKNRYRVEAQRAAGRDRAGAIVEATPGAAFRLALRFITGRYDAEPSRK